MKRCKWFFAEFPVSIRTLSRRLSAKKITENDESGFIIERVRDNFIEGKYIEKFEHTETFDDPFGHEISQYRIEYRSSQFRISSEPPGLEIYDSPRSIQGLVSALISACDYSLEISPVQVNPAKWAYSYLQKSKQVGAVVSAQIGAVEIELGITAKAVISGNRDVVAACSTLAGGRDYRLDKVQVRLQKPNKGTLVLTSSGGAKIDLYDAEGVASALRDALPIKRKAIVR